jgi:hypothetical protein
MSAAIYDIEIYQGDTFALNATAYGDNGSPLNLSGYTGFAGIKDRYGASGYLGIFDVTILPSGQFEMYMHHTGTAALPTTIALYDLEFASGEITVKYLRGDVPIYPQISKTFP